MIGAQGSPYLEPEHWQFNFGWRYQFSDRHFTGTKEDKERHRENSEVKNTLHLLDFGVVYGWSDQTSIGVSMPYVMAERSSLNRDFDERRIVNATGIGDLNVIVRRWLLDVHENLDQNIGVGFGLKLPTGMPNVQDSIKLLDDNDEVDRESRTVDQSIQPGDGGFGFIIEAQAFKRFGIFTPYFGGSYLFNPEEKNGVQTYRGAPDEDIMSIPDQYIARLGTMIAVPSVEGLAFGLGGRIEGIPVRDIIGPDGGFRRPGFAISVEPQIVYAYKKEVFSLSVPYAVVRNRQRSVPDQQNGRHGDAAFADYVILFSWSHRF